jgi:hypothetical protein
MTGIADRHRAETRLTCFGDRKVHGLATDHLAVAELSVDDCVARAFTNDERVLVGQDHAFGLPVDVFRDADDAVRFMTREVGVDEMRR